MSFTSEQSGNVSQGSMMSDVSNADSKMGGEGSVVAKYCDFEALKKKWRLEDVEEVKEMIRRVLTRQIVSDAELEAVKKRQEAAKNNDKIKKISQSVQKDDKNKFKKGKKGEKEVKKPVKR